MLLPVLCSSCSVAYSYKLLSLLTNFWAVFTKDFILALEVFLKGTKFLTKIFSLKDIHKAAENTFC